MVRSCSGKHVFCEFMAATAMSWPEDSASQLLSPPLFTSPNRKESQAINSYAPGVGKQIEQGYPLLQQEVYKSMETLGNFLEDLVY